MHKLRDNLGTVHQQYDICVLGSKQCGKSSLILRYVHDRFIESIDSGLEELHTKVVRKDGSYNEISILDTNSNQDHYSTSRKMQLLNNSGMILCYSIDDATSFHEMVDLYDRTLEFRKDMPPVVILGLKCDLEMERNISFSEGKEFADLIGALDFIECSGKLGIRIDDAFSSLVDIIFRTKLNIRKLSSTFKQNDLSSSLQSLKEILSSPSPTPDLPDLSDLRDQTQSPRSNKFIHSSPLTSTNQSFQNLDFEDMDIEIPKFKSNSFAGISPNEPIIGIAPDNNIIEPSKSILLHNQTNLPTGEKSRDIEITYESQPSDTNQRKTNSKITTTDKSSPKSESSCCVIV